MKNYLKSLSVGFIGAAILAVLWTLGSIAYTDHQFVRALVQIEQQRQAVPK